MSQESTTGHKEEDGKLFYELDWEFIEQMAERMDSNKGKYPRWNWKKEMDPEKIKQSIIRHTVEVMKGRYADNGKPYGHIEALACNAMILNHILKNG